ncbi:hypothetical protein ABB37_09159 [Leptomonas pyrrhocoris]|uniref:Uncharacterized protein n=1 Tax=Leptomonas pyrrhocoris TaxID=157538 RepID=A0A0M9FRD1_LEPPY|nr:hypothetical protein ABB37_09159 [Leptomonas pyrrhocoris]KPA74495.1 hypothetical protein ABB37_09159 [Leptomonas pyrrhocoris]|eukprot:XP_015652934.1 hypothetical protein ABB37_09159 [Leptomonas pyrrhocoris]
MGSVCSVRGPSHSGTSSQNAVSISPEKKSASLSAVRPLAATELGSAAQRPSRPRHTRAASFRRQNIASKRRAHSRAGLTSPRVRSPADEQNRQQEVELNATNAATAVSAAPSARKRPFVLHTVATKDVVDDASSTSASTLSSRQQRAQRAHNAVKRNACEGAAHHSCAHRSTTASRKHKHRKSIVDVPTPPDNPLKSLDSSQVLPPLEPTTPPAPTCRMRSVRRDSEPLAAEAAAPESAATDKAVPPTAEKAVAEPVVQPPITTATAPTTTTATTTATAAVPQPPPPPPLPTSTAALPSPATAPESNSTGHSDAVFTGVMDANLLSEPGVECFQSVSIDTADNEESSFAYENGYGMFFIATPVSRRDSNSGGEAAPLTTAAAKQRPLSPPPTELKIVKPLSRRHRRGSFVSFGGEIRLS